MIIIAILMSLIFLTGSIGVNGTSGELVIEVAEGNVEIENAISDQVDIQVDEGDVYLRKQ